ncbi:MAG: dTDP-4-dehydrorhamnose 3,5-epimerase [Anaerolineaceae bacterium]|nr:dTDP-4-dehydrorhamnose 3,5-epimerase [Anaerolineaceae bacterium]
MKFTPSTLPDLVLIEPNCYEDERGFFMETFQARLFTQAGLPTNFVQDNHSNSVKGTLRGLHYQVANVQGKLIRVVSGEIFDIVVDLRRSAPTFGKWVSTVLTAQNHIQLWVPPGFAHGFYTLSKQADITYKTTDYYNPQAERTIRWNDPILAITWPLISGQPLLISAKDAGGALFQDAEVFP